MFIQLQSIFYIQLAHELVATNRQTSLPIYKYMHHVNFRHVGIWVFNSDNLTLY